MTFPKPVKNPFRLLIDHALADSSLCVESHYLINHFLRLQWKTLISYYNNHPKEEYRSLTTAFYDKILEQLPSSYDNTFRMLFTNYINLEKIGLIQDEKEN